MEDPGQQEGGQQQQQQFFELHVLPPEDLDDFEMLVNLPAGVMARIGLNETGLTRALARGDFTLAEKIIEESTDPEYLNDGALAATPLNMVLTGRSSFFHQSRNLKLALLLMTRGANPNLRIPNHDMETASESPVELLLRYYLKLTEVFGLPGTGFCRTSYRPNSFEETELMDTVGINGEIGGLGPGQITTQARQLLLYCLEHGGDPNLPTTDAAKSIYHLALIAPRPDQPLLARMLELGANVNLADVHNTTPLMDVIALGDEARARLELSALQISGRAVLLDSQNCSLQSAVWRAMFQGQTRLVADLVAASQNGAGQSADTGARVELVPRAGSACAGNPCPRFPRQTIKFGVPSLLAPFLSDSPVTANLHVRLPRRRYSRGNVAGIHQFSPLAALHISRTLVAPVVDRGWLQGPSVTERMSTLVRLNTAHPVAGDAKVVDPAATVPLMFGELSSGLRQLAVRAVMRHLLFSRSPGETLALLDSVCRRSGLVTAGLALPPSGGKGRAAGGEILRQDIQLQLGDEVELSYTEAAPTHRSQDVTENGDGNIADVESITLSAEEMERSELRIANLGGPVDERTSGGVLTVDEVEDMSEILDALDKLDRELEVVRTDCVLQAVDRDLATWEVELEATLGRITRYQEELRSLQLPGCPVERRREASRVVGAEEARRRSQQLMEQLRSQRSGIVGSQADLATRETLMGNNRQQKDEQVVPEAIEELAQCMDSIQMEGDLLQVRLEHRSEEDRLETDRRRLDENWSLGSNRGLEENPGLSRHFSREVADADSSSSSSPTLPTPCAPLASLASPQHPLAGLPPGLASPQHTTDRLVQSLQVSVSVRAPPQPPVRASSLPSPPGLEFLDSSSDDDAWSQSWSQETPASPRTMASNLVTLNSRLFQQRRRIGAGAVALVDPSTPPLLPSGYEETEQTSDAEESSLSSESSSDSDTWGGTFSLRHTQSLRPSHSPSPDEAMVVSCLTARTLAAITDSLGVPDILRPCFALEAARLQLLLSLAGHQSIGCDRNCEGEESDSDSEEDWIASDTDSEDDTAEEVDGQEAPRLTDEAEDEESSDDGNASVLSNFSQRSLFGSQPEIALAEGGLRFLSPRSSFSPPLSSSSPAPSATSSSSAWLPDREDLHRMRQFLATDPNSDFNRSTASESEEY